MERELHELAIGLTTGVFTFSSCVLTVMFVDWIGKRRKR